MYSSWAGVRKPSECLPHSGHDFSLLGAQISGSVGFLPPRASRWEPYKKGSDEERPTLLVKHGGDVSLLCLSLFLSSWHRSQKMMNGEVMDGLVHLDPGVCSLVQMSTLS